MFSSSQVLLGEKTSQAITFKGFHKVLFQLKFGSLTGEKEMFGLI
jgi:hypothetical protein